MIILFGLGLLSSKEVTLDKVISLLDDSDPNEWTWRTATMTVTKGDDDIPFSALRANHLDPKSRSGKARHPLYKWKFPEDFTGANFDFRPIDKDQGPSDRINWKPHKYFLTYFSDHFQHMDFVTSYHYQKTYDNQLAGDEIEIEHIFQCNNSDGQSDKPEDQNDLRQKIQSPGQHESRHVL
ncbi:hypothetical protein QYM36_007235 [Artemia franciscana]|uniref:Uncharacterized protein n=1 Tax=Artemia franciscana TaxID=6661 RepID=A0AA88HZ73_ARTSF|nr:hypothetical protein QYM36_007235 [Artemia franciscana]